MSTAQPLADTLAKMLELQELDHQLIHWEKQRAALNIGVNEAQAKLKTAREAQDQMKKAWDDEKKKRGLLELEIKSLDAEAQKHNTQLSQLTSNEAYKAKLTEIQTCRKRMSELEEHSLKLIENEEVIKKQFEEQGQAAEAAVAEAASQESAAASQAAEFETKISGESAKRPALLTAMGDLYSVQYERFLKANKGWVIARVDQEHCTRCRVKVSPFQVNEARKLKSLSYCQNCGVILAA